MSFGMMRTKILALIISLALAAFSYLGLTYTAKLPIKIVMAEARLQVDTDGQYDYEEVSKVIKQGYARHKLIDAFLRGSGQKIVGYSFYGDLESKHMLIREYFKGIKENLQLMRTFYPGWIMRLYFDLEDKHPAKKEICDLACNDPVIDLCHVANLPGTPMVDARNVYPMNWRFFPTLDPQVDIFVSRDLDSRFSWRETSAVADWLLSDQPIHSMRDHRTGHNVPLLGAAWGSHMLKKGARSLWHNSWIKILGSDLGWTHRNVKGPDQQALKVYVWPWAQKYSLQHDAYLCESYPGSVGFPTRRLPEPNNHVAAIYSKNLTYVAECPIRCRLKDHQDWDTC